MSLERLEPVSGGDGDGDCDGRCWGEASAGVMKGPCISEELSQNRSF